MLRNSSTVLKPPLTSFLIPSSSISVRFPAILHHETAAKVRAGGLSTVWHVICSAVPMSLWLGFRIRGRFRLRGRNPYRTRRDKIPGDLSSQELVLLGSMPIPEL